jgi:hypothetical protein
MAKSKIPVPVPVTRGRKPRKETASVAVQTSFSKEPRGLFRKGKGSDSNTLKPPTFASTPSSGLRNLRISATQPSVSEIQSIEHGREAPSELRNNPAAISRISNANTNSKSKLLKTASYLANTQNQNLSNIIDNEEHLPEASNHEPSRVVFRLSSSESEAGLQHPISSQQNFVSLASDSEENDADMSSSVRSSRYTQLNRSNARSRIHSRDQSTPVTSTTTRSNSERERNKSEPAKPANKSPKTADLKRGRLLVMPSQVDLTSDDDDEEVQPSQAKKPRKSTIKITKLSTNKPVVNEDAQHLFENQDFSMNEPTTSNNANRNEDVSLNFDRLMIGSDSDATPPPPQRITNDSNSLGSSSQSSDSSVGSAYIPNRFRFNLYDYDRLVSQIKARKTIIDDFDHEIDELMHPDQQGNVRRSDRIRMKRINKLKRSKRYVKDIMKNEKIPIKKKEFNVDLNFVTFRKGNEGYAQQQKNVKKSRKTKNVVSPIAEE